jgi:6-phosphofructokinase 1
VQAVDKIKDTAESHDRLFFIEVMGRDAGFIALLSGIAGGAHHVLVPETRTYLDNLIRMLEYDKRRNKSAGVIIVAEGDDLGGAYEVAAKVKERYPEISYRVTILGHLQRGGSPSAMDRVLASELGHAAVNALIEGEKAVMVGKQHNELVYTPFSKATKQHNDMDYNLLEMTRILAL